MFHIRNQGKHIKKCGDEAEVWGGWLEAAWARWWWWGGKLESAYRNTSSGPLHSQHIQIYITVLLENTYFFCSFLFFSAGPPRVPIPKPSFGELSDSGVPAGKTTAIKLRVKELKNDANISFLYLCQMSLFYHYFLTNLE